MLLWAASYREADKWLLASPLLKFTFAICILCFTISKLLFLSIEYACVNSAWTHYAARTLSSNDRGDN